MKEKITIYTLAEELNLSPSAVSRAFKAGTKLNAVKRQLVLEAAEKHGFKPNRMASRLSMNPINIGVLIYGGFKPYYDSLVSGIEAAHKRMSDYKIGCDLRLMPRAEYSGKDCAAVLDEFAEKGYDGVIVSGLYDEFTDAINKTVDAGCKVVTLHYDLPDSKRLFASNHNFESAGNLASDFLHACKCKSTIIFTGNMKTPVHKRIVDGFRKSADAHGIEIAGLYDLTDISCDKYDLALDIIQYHADTADSAYITTGDSLEICRAFADCKGYTLVASDTYPQLNEYIENGIVSASVFQNPSAQAETAFEVLCRHLSEGLDVGNVREITPLLIMKSNLKFYL